MQDSGTCSSGGTVLKLSEAEWQVCKTSFFKQSGFRLIKKVARFTRSYSINV